jgi:hypothetical protein
MLIFTSLFGYLEWGKDSHSFLFQVEFEVFSQFFTNPASVPHPFILVPLFGQVLILVTLFQSNPSKILTYIGMACLGLLLGLMFFIGLWGFNFKILISTLPFTVTVILVIRNFSK